MTDGSIPQGESERPFLDELRGTDTDTETSKSPTVCEEVFYNFLLLMSIRKPSILTEQNQPVEVSIVSCFRIGCLKKGRVKERSVYECETQRMTVVQSWRLQHSPSIRIIILVEECHTIAC